MASTIAVPRSRKNIRDLASAIRQAYGLEDTKAFPIVQFLEYVFPDSYDIISDEEMGDCDGKTYPEKNLILLKESVYNDACCGNPRDRFTIAHEIGHLFLHGNESISYARTDKKIKAYENPEWQANTFAAELLIPINPIKNLSPIEIANKYKVSVSAATIQLKQAINSSNC